MDLVKFTKTFEFLKNLIRFSDGFLWSLLEIDIDQSKISLEIYWFVPESIRDSGIRWNRIGFDGI